MKAGRGQGSGAKGQTKGQTMSQVTVTINGRQFRMACEDGQEGHLMRLAQDLDQRIEKLRGNFGEIGDARLTIMAALTVADELADINSRLKRVEEELASLQEARVASAEHAKATQAAISAALNAAAERIEGLTRQLNQTAAESRRRDGVRPLLAPERRRSSVATAGHPHYIAGAGLHGSSGAIFSGPYRSLRELSLTGPVGPDTWRPPTFVGNPGSTLQRPLRLRTSRDSNTIGHGRACPGHPRL